MGPFKPQAENGAVCRLFLSPITTSSSRFPRFPRFSCRCRSGRPGRLGTEIGLDVVQDVAHGEP